MRNLLIAFAFCGLAPFAWASADCPSTTTATHHTRPAAAEFIASAAAQAPIATAAVAEPAALVLPASVHDHPTQVMGGPPGPAASMPEEPHRHSRVQLVLASLGLMLVIVLRRLAASDR
jgi:hypothetical protein